MLAVERGCAGLEHIYGMPAGNVEPGGDQGVHGISEPKYPTASTLGNNKGLSLPGVMSAPFWAPQNLCHSQHLLQGSAGGLWL